MYNPRLWLPTGEVGEHSSCVQCCRAQHRVQLATAMLAATTVLQKEAELNPGTHLRHFLDQGHLPTLCSHCLLYATHGRSVPTEYWRNISHSIPSTCCAWELTWLCVCWMQSTRLCSVVAHNRTDGIGSAMS